MEYRSHPISRLSRYSRNRIILMVLILVSLLCICTQLLNLTILSHDKYEQRAHDNIFSKRLLSYPRGNILDGHDNILATNVKEYSISFNRYRLKKETTRLVLQQIEKITGKPSVEKIEAIISSKAKREFLARGIPQNQMLPFLERPEDFPGVQIHENFYRLYNRPIEFSHLIGFVGKLHEGEEKTYTYPRYLLDSEIGRSGMERFYEERLAGYPGKEEYQLDARGRYLSDPKLEESSRPGENLYLTLDSRLQKRAYGLFLPEGGGVPRKGTILLMEVKTGAVIVMASLPAFNSSKPGLAETMGLPTGWMNLAIRGLYPPGSTFKVVGAAAALKKGIPIERDFYCAGRYQLEGWDRSFWCAFRGGHGNVNLTESLKKSCNVYYFKLVDEIGFESFRQVAATWEFGQKTGIDLPGENAGQIAGMEHPGPGETLNLAIGQGTMLATPLQVCRIYAGLANQGKMPKPYCIDAIGYDRITGEKTKREFTDMGLTAQQLAIINKGLFQVVNEPGGTAYKAEIPTGWEVAGKTGTAENSKGTNDAWFAGFFPYSAPEYAFVIHIEDTDKHGGEEAGPVARDLISLVFSNDVEVEEPVAIPSE
jgi:penicillin-binding protein 2